MAKRLLLLALAALLTGGRTPAASTYTDAIVAIVNGKAITVSDVTRETRTQEQDLAKRLSGEDFEKRVLDLRQRAAQDLVDQEVLYAEFQKLEYKVPREAVLRRMDRIVQNQAGGNRERFETELRRQGLSADEFDQKVTRLVAVELLLEARVRRRVYIAPAAVTAAYEEHRQEYRVPDRLRLEMILLKKDGRFAASLADTAAKVVDRARQGEAFAKLAAEFSDDPGAGKGGDLGWMEESQVRPQFRDAVKDLKPGEVSSPVTLADGVCVLRLAEVERGQTLPLDDALREKIEERLRRAEEEKLYKDYLGKLRVLHHVETFF